MYNLYSSEQRQKRFLNVLKYNRNLNTIDPFTWILKILNLTRKKNTKKENNDNKRRYFMITKEPVPVLQ